MNSDMETRPITLPKDFWAHIDRWRLERDASASAVVERLIIDEIRRSKAAE